MYGYCAKISDVLSDKDLFIPMYQRKYSWTSEDAYKFLDDLMHVPEGKHKYFGSVVLKRVSDNEGRQSFAIVDGQQRLLTACLALFAARDSGAEFAFSINLIPHLADEEAFDRISANREASGNTQMDAIYTLFNQMLRREDGATVTRCIEALLNALVTVTELGDDDDGAGVLESLNTSGRKMSESDLVRGLDFQCSNGNSVEYNALWQPFDEAVQVCGVDSDELLARAMIAAGVVKDRDQIDSLGLFRAYSRAINTNAGNNFSREVCEYSKRALKASRFKFGQAFTAMVECMRQQPVVNLEYQIITTQIAVCEGVITEDQGTELLTAVNAYCVRALLGGEDKETVNTAVSQAFSTDVGSTVYELFYKTRSMSPYLHKDFMELLSGSNAHERSVMAYILKCLEIKNSRKEVSFEDAYMSKVVPDHYDTSWDTIFGTREQYDMFNSRFGNSLVNYAIVEEALGYDNENAETAIKALTKSRFSLTRGWAKQHDFSEEAVQARFEVFAKLSRKLFAVPEVDTQVALAHADGGFVDISTVSKTAGLKATGVKVDGVTLEGEEYKVRCRTWKALCLYILERYFDTHQQAIAAFSSMSQRGAFAIKGESFTSTYRAEGMLEVCAGVYVSLPSQGQAALKRVSMILSALGSEPVYVRLEK